MPYGSAITEGAANDEKCNWEGTTSFDQRGRCEVGLDRDSVSCRALPCRSCQESRVDIKLSYVIKTGSHHMTPAVSSPRLHPKHLTSPHLVPPLLSSQIHYSHQLATAHIHLEFFKLDQSHSYAPDQAHGDVLWQHRPLFP